jgi:hypothetical protein
MHPTNTQPNKPVNSASESSGSNFASLNERAILELSEVRKKLLEQIKNEISLKRFYAIEEKLKNEEKTLMEILDWRLGKSTQLSKYSLILDPHYFEQEFLN